MRDDLEASRAAKRRGPRDQHDGENEYEDGRAGYGIED